VNIGNLEIKFPKLSIGTVTLLIIAAVGLYSAFVRYTQGFGAMTNMSDSRPWAFWISFDLLVGVAISAGAFVIAGTTHLFHLKKYEPIVRPALLTGFLGYILVSLGLLVDLGQPQRIWHMMIYRNIHSPLFEVGMCVMIYLTVLLLEFIPAILEKFGLAHQAPWKWIKNLSIPLIISGFVLSTMHQSTLGTLYLIVPHKMHPLWYTPILPIIFFTSALAVGFGMVIFETVLSHHIFGWDLHEDILQGLGKGLRVSLVMLLMLKVGDLIYAGEMGLILEGNLQSKSFILENVAGIILPIIILTLPRLRVDPKWIFRAGLLTVIGLVLHRFNLSMVGLAGDAYFPHWMEIAATAGLFALGLLAFGMVALNVPMHSEH
jgi:Ni/Fe-hydrogenase subunit HybB-like protein